MKKSRSPDGGRRAAPRPGARALRTRWRDRLGAHLDQHRQVAAHSLRRFFATPLQNLATVLVIAIALALPAGLYLLVATVQQLAGSLESANRVTLYLRAEAAPDAIPALRHKLQRHPAVAATTYVSPAEGLAQFKAQSGFGDVLELLDGNPLPPVILVTANASADSAALAAEVGSWPEVDQARLDSQWLARVRAMAALGRQLTLTLAAALALGVLLTVGNTIRLAIENRREEILVLKLVGGTDAFVRRPFLYLGFWYGLSGGVCAWLLLATGRWWLQLPLDRLAALYQARWTIAPVGATALLALAGVAAGLGIAGARLAAGRQMRSIEP
ncbi:MAG: ABC transporter permease [Pseudomonadales bacterium]|nr:ABC transporter permease [Pseudomonadales bacterium]